MSKKEIHIDWRIFRKAVSETLNPEEQSQMDQWLNASENNRIYFERAVKYYNKDERRAREDYQPAYQAFLNKTTKKRNKILLSFQVAASVVLLVASVWFLSVVRNGKAYQKLSEADLINAKEGQVELVLSTGEKLLLSKEGSQSIQEKSGEIKKNKGEVDYLSLHEKKQKYLQYNTIKVPRGTDFKLVLSDSTVVWLNAESSITYPIQFADHVREVEISGEVYLDVTKDKSRPFVVKVNQSQIKVLGTEFNIKAYPEDQKIYTTLVEGSVEVKNKFGKKAVLSPNQQAIAGEFANVQLKEIDVNQITSWRRGVFNFEDKALGDILDDLSRWYDLKVFYESEELKTYEFTGGINRYDNVNKLLKLFELTKSVKFYIKDDVLLVKKASK